MKKAFWQDKVKWAVGQVARDLVKALYPEGFSRELLAEACARLNTKWKQDHRTHDAMTADEFQEKYAWLADLQAHIRDGKVPRWARL